MHSTHRSTFGVVMAMLAISAVLFVSKAFTASNTVPGDNLGEGAGVISGYTISTVAYTLNATTPTNIDAVTFTTNSAAATVKAKLVAAGSTWYTCVTTNGPTNTAWSCNTTAPQATVAASDQLRVVAAQ